MQIDTSVSEKHIMSIFTAEVKIQGGGGIYLGSEKKGRLRRGPSSLRRKPQNSHALAMFPSQIG
jgi:hypothetical protein